MSEAMRNEISIEELSAEQVKEIKKIFVRFVKKYEISEDKESSMWLVEQLKEELPDKDEEAINKMAEEIVEAVKEYDKDLSELNQECKKGTTKETWLADKLQDSAKGIAVNTFGNYLAEIDKTMEIANAQMERVVLRMDGEVSQCLNLDGFIAEQYHVNSFNANAVLEQSPYRARLCINEGEAYGKNSVDTMIDNISTGQKGVARYQFKYGKDSASTIEMLKKGDYNNQRIVVPKNQVEEVQAAFPNKSVTDHIGGTDTINVKSEPITKEQMKELQNEVQLNSRIPKTDWNGYETQKLAINIGKQAGNAGVHAALLGAGIHIVQKAFEGEEVEADEVVETALITGTDTCVKSAASGALKVATEKGLIPLLAPGTPAGTIAKIACVGVENVKILWRVAKGELTMSEATEQMGRSSVAMYAGLTAAASGAGIGSALLSGIPVVGPILGGIVGGMVGYVAGSKVGETVFDKAKDLVQRGKDILKRGFSKISSNSIFSKRRSKVRI